MHSSMTELYVHIVWATWDRRPLITPTIEPVIYRTIEAECHRLGCQVYAIGGVEDHLHILLRLHASVAVAELVKQMKGVSSHLIRTETDPESGFRWQGSYGAFSLGRPDLDRVRGYVQQQKARHQNRQLWTQWEQCGDDRSGDNRSAAGNS